MTLRLYDSATRQTRAFEPLRAGEVSIYLCGATVQAPPHVGHIRSALVFDQLWRWLEYHGYAVTLIRNVTDIDDKILAKSVDNGLTWWAWAYENEQAFQRAYDVLNMKRPTYEPRATGHVTEMIELMRQLIDAGHAYPAEDGSGDVYFDVRSWPSYGVLTGMKVDEMEPATDADPRGKRDPRDFALWKGAKPGEPSWPTPWGAGRPGWHLECSAMAGKYLGDAFDIHGGGVDLRFPHENELAQSTAVGQRFAVTWMHNAWVTTSGEKMSKSLGNSLLVDEVVQRVRPVELRYYLGSAHYRSHVEYSEEALAEAATAYQRIEGFLERAGEVTGHHVQPTLVSAAFAAAMDDDLGVPAALGALHDTVREGNRLLADGDSEALHGVLGSVRAMLGVLGLDPSDPGWGGSAHAADVHWRAVVDSLVAAALVERQEARERRDFAAADAVRDRLAAAGVSVEDTAAGPRWTVEGRD